MPQVSDLRHALRLLAKSPAFAVTAVVSLALGVGASAAIFSVTDALVVAPIMGIRNPAEVVDIGRSNEGRGFDNMAYPVFRYLREHSQTVAAMAAVEFGGGPMSLGENGSSERVLSDLVSGNYFDVLGTRPALGRFFRADEDQVPGERPVVVLSYDFWMRRFNGDPRVLERTLRLNNREFAVVGVAEPGFQGTTFVGTDLWVPMAMLAAARGLASAARLDEPRSVWHVAVGRLVPGITRAQALAELNTLAAAYKAQEPRANPRHAIAVSATSRIPPPVRLPFLGFIGFLFVLTGSLLAIACSNVAGMLLARATVRRREMATRLAVGASRGQLLAQLLTETLVLFLAAALVALPLTMAILTVLERSLPALPVIINLDLAVNWRVVAFAVGLALVTAAVFGLAPARHALGGELAALLHGANATADRKRFRLRNGLVVAQVALSLTLVVVAFLFLRTLRAASTLDPGFETANTLVASIDVSLGGYRGQPAAALAERYRDRLRAIDGVVSAASARMIPLQGSGFGLGPIRVPGVTGPASDGTWDADWDVVSPEYFQTIRMPLVEGRAFEPSDRDGAPPVAVVNQSFATRAWPGRSAVGQVIEQDLGREGTRRLEVVGVAHDAKYRYLSDEGGRLFVYVPMAQQPVTELVLYVRHAPARAIADDVRRAMAQVEPSVPLIMLQSFDDATAIGLLPQRLAAWIAGGVGTVGILLAALGVYGLMAFLVAQRTRELAIRIALGASRDDVRRMVLRQAARLGLVGGVAGLAMAALVGVLAERLLIGVAPVDPIATVATAALFAAVLIVASWAPARRAAATDPATALRAE
jgi:predicted permease